MRVELAEDKIIVTDCKSDFNVEKTLLCGQLFRYFPLADGSYNVISRDKICRIYNQGDDVIIETNGFRDYFYNYFDLDANYDEIYSALAEFEELESAIANGRGIRILRQDLFECIISFIISANNNIPRIRLIIEKLCDNFGRDIGGGYHAFVTLEEASRISLEDFSSIGAGFRASYLYNTIKTLSEVDVLSGMDELDTKSLIKRLTLLSGVGDKVASCIALYGMQRYEAFPVDTWIQKANPINGLDTPEKTARYYMKRYKNLAGFAQQLIYYNKRNLGQ